jgi:hypothetical protein
MSSKLSRYDKDAIIKKVVGQTFDARAAELDRRETDLALKVRNHLMTAAQIAAIDSLPRDFYNNATHGNPRVRFQRPEDTKSTKMLEFSEETKVPAGWVVRTHLLEDETLWAEVETLFADKAACGSERLDFKEKTTGVIYTFNTTKAVMDAWPTLRELMGEDFFKSAPRSNVPAPLINELDEILKAAKPFEAIAA